MARQSTWLETVRLFDPLVGGHWYPLTVTEVVKSRSPKGIRVALRHLSKSQLGRTHSLMLPLPIRPEGATRDWLVACGVEVAIGQKVAPKDAVGATILVRFLPKETGGFEPVDFRPIPKEHDHGPAEST